MTFDWILGLESISGLVFALFKKYCLCEHFFSICWKELDLNRWIGFMSLTFENVLFN